MKGFEIYLNIILILCDSNSVYLTDKKIVYDNFYLLKLSSYTASKSIFFNFRLTP